jgi:hypothetical protein
MTNFSTNQVMQFYVAPSISTGDVKTIPGRGKIVTFKGYNEPKKSDIIENVLWAKVTTSEALATPLKMVPVKFAEGHTPIKGETYIVRVSFPEIPGAGIESWTTKSAVVQVKDEDAAKVIKKFEAELKKVLPEYIDVEDNAGTLEIAAKPEALAYKRGFRPMVIPEFNVAVNKVTDEGELVDWAELDEKGLLAVSTKGTLSGTYKLADMEYFALGERGDEYRQMGWPDVVYEPEYKVEIGAPYNVLVLHYGYKGANDQSHLSEKDLIIASTLGTEVLVDIAKALGAEKVSVVEDKAASQIAEKEL